MKGVKTTSFANATAARFQSDDILAKRIQMPDGIEVHDSLKKMVVEQSKLTLEMKRISEENKKMSEENKKLHSIVTELETRLKELSDKVNTFEMED